MQSLIDKLRDLAATKFADSAAAATPVFDATVTSNNGKRVEKVSITKQGDTYFAKRENEPSIYELDGKAVEDLQKAANDVKEVPAAQEEVATGRLSPQPASGKSSRVNGLLTDLYELTMAAGYFDAGKPIRSATFEFTIRRLPAHRNFVLAAGLPQAIDYLLNLSFSGEEIDYLRGLPAFAKPPPASSIICAASASRAMFSRSPKARRCSPASR